MFLLATDVQKIILEFLEPQEIKEIYETCKDAKIMFDELTTHTNFIVDCYRIISDEELKWYKLKNIKLKLLEKYEVDICGNQMWYKNGKLHSDNDLPAFIAKNGDQFWYKNNICYRENDLPSIISSKGDQYWCDINGKLHRDNDLPSIITTDGDQYWSDINGKLHRDNDLPAAIHTNGIQGWYKNGKKHRDNGLPALINLNGDQYWFENGLEIKHK